ncbi:MAG: 5-formyltetrahydrofolate cyclo-ligase [Rhodobacteraceae bacterium]|nr:5-formyltetrahydrofolate cyclo-ligase [Paracoccaceae bacterium]
MADMAARKAAARAEAFARRKAAFAGRGPEDARHLAGVLAAHRGAVLSGYMPMRTEIDPLPAMTAHAAAGGIVGVPVIPGRDVALVFRRWRPGAPMLPGAFGALVPADPGEVVPSVLVVPMLAFDRRGFRLGYGGGYYDRTLAGLRAAGPVTAIGFAFAAQEVEAVPVEPTDARLDLIVTEAGVIAPAD